MTSPEIGLRPLPMVWNQFACLDFVDSEFADHTGGGRRFDRLERPEWQRAFLDRWGWRAPVPAPAAAIAGLRELRPRLRRILESGELPAAELKGLNRLLARVRFVYEVSPGPRLEVVALAPDWDHVAAELVSSTVQLLATGEPGRVKVCANPDCSWIFYDESLNRSRRWCQAAICGNLVKVRRHRASGRQA